MPEISRFLGIVIFMVYDDHKPAHFHARYGEYKISVEIETGIVDGKFPRRALNAVLEWYQLYKDKLMEDWNLALLHDNLKPIPPLE
ncbi:MAG: transcriptional regulator [Ignavibacteria bacterium GWF2_33_9]|nr:MAG: transcriptional regulator [Ignavibacteria bacterium GWF2_33_9]